MKEFRIVVEVNDEHDFELHTLIPFRDGLLAVFVKDLEDEDVG